MPEPCQRLTLALADGCRVERELGRGGGTTRLRHPTSSLHTRFSQQVPDSAAAGVIAKESMSDVSGIMSPSGPRPPRAGKLAQGAVVCGVPGMALGALIGSNFRDLRRVYPRGTAPDGGVR